MKRLHRIVLSLCLSLLLCVTCSSLFSVKASAFNPEGGVLVDSYKLKTTSDSLSLELAYSVGPVPNVVTFDGVFVPDTVEYRFSNISVPNRITYMLFGDMNSRFNFEYLPDLYDYYFLLYIERTNDEYLTSNSNPFVKPVSVNVLYRDGGGPGGGQYKATNLSSRYIYDGNTRGISVFGQIPPNSSYASICGFSLRYNSGTFTPPESMFFNGLILAVKKGSSFDDVVSAIENQTGQIIDKIDEVLTPEGDNNLGESVDQITDQVQENLGALGFAHDTVENFIGLFNEEPPAPVINVPPLKMKIKGVEHQFFNGYQYDFRSMEEGGLSVLVGAVRTAGTLVLWWAFLQYCLKEFDQFFRR